MRSRAVSAFHFALSARETAGLEMFVLEAAGGFERPDAAHQQGGLVPRGQVVEEQIGVLVGISTSVSCRS